MTSRFALALAVTLAVPAAQAADPALTTEDQKTVYAMGYAFAKNLDAYAFKPEEIDIFIAAIRDASAGKDAPIDVETYVQKVKTFSESRGAEAAKGEKAASAEFEAKEAAAAGATKSASGLIKRVVKEGSGASPVATDTVKVHYHGTFRDGTVFDSSVERGEPAEFPLNRVIPCWTEGVQKMKVGGKAKLTCPPAIAYGTRGAGGVIPPNATLNFEIELLAVKGK